MLVEQPPPSVDRSSRTVELSRGGAQIAQMADLAALRLVLLGESSIDMARLWFPSRSAVDRFLRLHQYDTDNPLDVGRLQELHRESVEYLTDLHGMTLPSDVEQPNEVHDLFLLATGGARDLQAAACKLLKVMQVYNHLAGREIVFNTQISEAELLARLNTKVFQAVDEMRASGIVVEEFATGKKKRSSLVTKLLAKRDNLATHVFDKLRFRIVVGRHEDLVQALLYLVQHLIPFNYVVPGQGQNGLISHEDVATALDIPVELVRARFGAKATPDQATPQNDFSGSTYRCVNFVADIPLRIDDLAVGDVPAVAVVQAEIQLVDAAADEANNRGENSHDRYKERQRRWVRERFDAAVE